MSKKYINNLESGKIELHFTKEEYKALSEDLKKEIQRAYLFSRYNNAWVSRSKHNHYSALEVAQKLGFTEEEQQGERLSYEEELNRKVERAERRIERYESYADNAESRAENLQKEFNTFRSDIAFLTQPIIRGHKGSEAFGRRRNAIMHKYNKGFEEYRKSNYFKEKAQIAQATANKTQYKDKTYLYNRIKECTSKIRKLEKNAVHYEDILYKKQNNIEIAGGFYNSVTIEQVEKYLENTLKDMEYELDKKAFMQNCIDELGGVTYSKENIKVGYLVKIRRDWEVVIKANEKTVEVKSCFGSCIKYPYAQIQDVKIPEGFKEEKEVIKNPYKINDILVHYSIGADRIITAYQVLKVTPKGVQIQKINVENNKPIKDNFTNDKPCRKKIVTSKYSDFVGVYDGDWQLHLYK